MHGEDTTVERTLASAGLGESDVLRLVEMLRAGQTDLAALSGLEPEELDAAYAKAHQLARDGLHEPAMQILSALTVLRPAEPRYFRAFGLACQRANQLSQAAVAYAVARALDPTDIISEILQAECHLRVRGIDEGRRGLEAAVRRGSSDPLAQPYLERAAALLQRLEKAAP